MKARGEARIHLLHKPAGPSSREVLEAALRRPGGPRLVHGGALDPFASGLLLGLVGEATRLFPFLHGIPKVYLAELRFGSETDNGDPLGTVVARGDPRGLRAAAVAEALASFVGWTEQVPPATSNLRIDGERAWARAHRGEAVTLAPRRVYLHAARLVAHGLPRWARVEVTVAGGYYVRALARDLGRLLGVPAHLGALWRSRIGPWRDPGPGGDVRVEGEALLPWCPARRLDDAEAARVARGEGVPLGPLEPPTWPLPAGFPDPPVRLLHAGRVVGVDEVRLG